jgi:hypothetical protein
MFAALSCHRDRALVALLVSTGACAGELLGLRQQTSPRQPADQRDS